MLVKIKGIHKVKMKLADGSTQTYYYAWRGGPKMKAKPHTEAFSLEHARLKEVAKNVVSDTLKTIIDHFTGSEDARNPDFTRLAQKTQDDHLYAHKLILKEWPELPLRFTQARGFKADIRKWHRSFKENPRKADKLLFSLSKVFSYAIADELIDKNPCTGIGRLYDGSRREMVWSAEHIATCRKELPAWLLLPFEIALLTCQRQGDILAMSWKDYDGTYMHIRQSKTGARVKVKVHSRLKALLDPMDKNTLRICLNSRKRPWTKDGFKTSWGKALASDEIKIEGVTFHDLRGTFITERFREGASIEDISLISGHTHGEIRTVLNKHYLSPDQGRSDALIDRMEGTSQEQKM